MSMSKISYSLYEVIVQQRICDGYINATQLCKAHRQATGEYKDPKDWLETNSASLAVAKLSEFTGISATELIQREVGHSGGTWIHPRLAVRYSIWLNDDLSPQIEEWVQQWSAAEQNPVQITFSELNNLIGMIDVSIKAAEMTHTVIHGLVYFLNRVRENLEVLRNIQNPQTAMSADLYQQQLERAEKRMNNLASKIDKLHLINNVEEDESINVIDLTKSDYQQVKNKVLLLEAEEDKSSKPMFFRRQESGNSLLVQLLSVKPDREADGSAPVLLEYSGYDTTLALTYQWSGMLLKTVTVIDGPYETWSITINHNHLCAELSSFVSHKDTAISLALQNGNLCLTIGNREITIPSWNSELELDLNDLELHSEDIEMDGALWKELEAAARVAKYNKPDVCPAIVRQGICLSALANVCSVTGFSHIVGCHRAFLLKQDIAKGVEFVLPVEVIDLIKDLKPEKITIQLHYTFKQALITVDENYILVDTIQGKFPVFDGLFIHRRPEISFKRRDLQYAISRVYDAGLRTINLTFDNNHITIQSGSKIKETIPATVEEDLTTKVEIAVDMLLDAIKTISATEIFFNLSTSNKNVLNVETYSGVIYMFLLAVTVKKTLESTDEVLGELRSDCQLVERGRNGDGSEYIIEIMNGTPLEENFIEKTCQLQAKIISPAG